MKINVPTENVECWQVDGWMKQAYSVVSVVQGYEGEIICVAPTCMVVRGRGGNELITRCIPTKEAFYDGFNIVLGDRVG